MPAKLVMTKGLLLGREELLQRDALVVGRSSSSDISVQDELVSRRHAQLQLRDNRWYVTDLQSANGTYINDRRLAEGEVARLRLGDRLGLGGSVEYTLMDAPGVPEPFSASSAYGYPAYPPGGAQGGQRQARRDSRTALWISLGALLLVAAIAGGAVLWRNATQTDVENKEKVVVPGGEAAVTREKLVPQVPAAAITPATAPAAAAPTRKIDAVVPAASNGVRATMAGGGAGAAAGGAMGGAAGMAGGLEQMPAMLAQAFPGVQSDELPSALTQALQSGQIQPQQAQGFVRALFPGVQPAQLPTVLAGSFAGFSVPQIQSILQLIYPGTSFSVPNVNSRTGAVVYAALDDAGQMNLYQLNADGSGKQLLVEAASEPAFSPDGKRLAYFSDKPDQVGLRIRDMDTGATVALTNSEGDAYPSWAPDGKRLAFWDLNDNNVVVINADGTGRRPIAAGEFPDWSPRGDRIATKGCVANDCGIVLINPDGSSPVRITTNANDGQPAWSPDGRSVAFVSNRDGNWEIYVVNADGSWLRRITNDPHTDGLPAWSADGMRIAFRSDRDGRWAIYTATGVGGPPVKLVDAPVQDTGPDQWTWEQLTWR